MIPSIKQLQAIYKEINGCEAGDVHRLRAAHHYGVQYNEVTREQRLMGKAINYGELYGVESATGRMSISPEMQFIRREPLVWKPRPQGASDLAVGVGDICERRVCASPLFSIPYGAIEARIVAGEDIHSVVGEAMTGWKTRHG